MGNGYFYSLGLISTVKYSETPLQRLSVYREIQDYTNIDKAQIFSFFNFVHITPLQRLFRTMQINNYASFCHSPVSFFLQS